MHDYEALGYMIVQELINIRSDFKSEIQRLGDRLEKCFNLQSTCLDKDNSTINSDPTDINDRHHALNVCVADYDCSTSLYQASDFSQRDISPNRPTLIKKVPLDKSRNIKEVLKSNVGEDISDFQNISMNNDKAFGSDRPTVIKKGPLDEIRSAKEVLKSNVCKDISDSQNISLDNDNAVGSDFELQTLPPKAEKEQNINFPTVSAVMENVSPSLEVSEVSFDFTQSECSKNADERVSKSLDNLNTISQRKKRKQPKIQCKICQKFFVPNYFHRHLATHSNVKPFICNVCGKPFAVRFNMERHMCLHTGVYPFVCQICGKKFVRKDRLESHMCLHTGVRPFACKKCGRTYARKDYLQNHTCR